MRPIKSFLGTAILLALSLSAMAKESEKEVCLSMNSGSLLRHAQFSDLEKKEPKVTLYFKPNNIHERVLTGTCQPDKMATEWALNCNILANTDFGYHVNFYFKPSPANGGMTTEASYSWWSMSGEGPLKLLNCNAF